MSHYYCRSCHGADGAEFEALANVKTPPYTTCDFCHRDNVGRLARSGHAWACELCGKPRQYWQRFCGAACSALWEGGARPSGRD